jgi:hypothetical protein
MGIRNLFLISFWYLMLSIERKEILEVEKE